MPLFVVGLAVAMSLSFSTASGPVPGDRTTNKPSEQTCAEARAAGRTLPGCTGEAEGELDEARPGNSSTDDRPDRPRDRFIICPGDTRCPPR
jgi:hypothetical protein